MSYGRHRDVPTNRAVCPASRVALPADGASASVRHTSCLLGLARWGGRSRELVLIAQNGEDGFGRLAFGDGEAGGQRPVVLPIIVKRERDDFLDLAEPLLQRRGIHPC